MLGSFAAMIMVDDGAQQAVAAALGAAADAVAVAGLDEAVAILGVLRDEGAGSAELVIAADAAARRNGDTPAGHSEPAGTRHNGDARAGRDGAAGTVTLPAGARPALDLVRAPDGAAGPLAWLLGDVVVAADLSQARELVRAHPALRVVTRDGDLLGAHWAKGGSATAPSLLETRAATG